MKLLTISFCCMALTLAATRQDHDDDPLHPGRADHRNQHPDKGERNRDGNGLGVFHSFGKRSGETIEEIEKRDTTVHGHVEHDKDGTHAGAGVEHHSNDDKTHTEDHVEHSTKGRSSYGGSFGHTFWKRDLENALIDILKRDTSIHGHVDHDKDGTHVGGGISHSSKDGKTDVGAHVEHSTHGGTSYGVGGSHTWSHSGGSKTTVSGGISHGSHGNSGGVSVTHTFGRRLVELEEAVRELERRDTTAHGHVEHDKDGTHAGAGVEHHSNDDKTHTEAHVEHSTKGGSSYGGSFSHTFGKRDLENALKDIIERYWYWHSKDGKTHAESHVRHNSTDGTSYGGGSFSHTFGKRDLEDDLNDILKRDTTVHGNVEHDKDGTHAGAGVEHHSKDDKTDAEAHVEHSTKEGSSYGGSFSHTFWKRDLENALNGILKKDTTTVHGHVEHDKDGTHVGAGVEHHSNDDKTHVKANVEHGTKGRKQLWR